MRYIDTHCHINFPAYEADQAAVIERARSNETGMIIIGTGEQTSASGAALAQSSKDIWSIIGLHPIHVRTQATPNEEVFNPAFYGKLLKENDRIVGIGECGFDFFHGSAACAGEQEVVFRQHVELAQAYKKPLMLHLRNTKEWTPAHGAEGNAYRAALDIIREYRAKGIELRGNAHFFAGTVDEAKEFIELGFTVSFTGVITFARSYDDCIRAVPLESILSETDSPFVAPVPHRGERNEPFYVQEVVAKVAEIKGLPLEEVRLAMIANAKRVFGL